MKKATCRICGNKFNILVTDNADPRCQEHVTERRTQTDGSTHMAVVGPAGAVSFYYFPSAIAPDRDGMMAGDVVVHTPMTSGYGYADCEFVEGGCDTNYWSGTAVLDMLVDEGEDAVFAKLEDVYFRHFFRELMEVPA